MSCVIHCRCKQKQAETEREREVKKKKKAKQNATAPQYTRDTSSTAPVENSQVTTRECVLRVLARWGSCLAYFGAMYSNGSHVVSSGINLLYEGRSRTLPIFTKSINQ